jgi:hypothetical protein
MDPQSKYTDTYTLRGEFRVINPGSGAGSNNTAAYVIKPNPFLSVIDVQSWSGGPSTSSAIGFNQLSSNTYMWGMTNPLEFQSKMSTYRVVSHGIRIRLMIPQLETTGRMIVARAPRSRTDPSWLAVNNYTFTYAQQAASYDNITTIPINPVANSSALLQFPDAYEVSLIDMIGHDLTIVNSVNSYEAFNFIMPGSGTYDTAFDTALRNEIGSGSVAAGVVGSQSVAVGAFPDSPMGWDDFYLFFDGLPQRNAATPIVNIEFMYHLEGVPSISSSTSISPLPSSANPQIRGATLQRVLDVTTTMAKNFVTDAAQAFVSSTINALNQRGQPRISL